MSSEALERALDVLRSIEAQYGSGYVKRSEARALLVEVARLEQERDEANGMLHNRAALLEAAGDADRRTERAEAALAVARKRGQRLRSALRDAIANIDAESCMDYPLWAALVDEPAAATGTPKPRLLDLFCGAGGAAMGYARAGFDVTGVDNAPQKHYPFEFIEADATAFPLDGFDAIHASPPCQDHMQTPHRKHGTGWMLPHTRARLLEQAAPWVIENVPGAPMRPDFRICGCQVGLELRRERWFETSWEGFQMNQPHHHPHAVPSVVGHGTPSWVREKLGYNPSIAHYRASMGIDWMNRDELSQAIPPAYTELIGHQLMQHVTLAAGVSGAD